MHLDDLKTTSEEADVIMIQQVAKVVNDGVENINVFCDDTYVFILFVYHFAELQLQCSLTMESTGSGRVVIYIGPLQENMNESSDNHQLHTLSPDE